MYSGLSDYNQRELRFFVFMVMGLGYRLSFSDGFHHEVTPIYRDPILALEHLGEMDVDNVTILDDKNFEKGWFMLVYGNSPGELLADYTDNAECERIFNLFEAAFPSE